MNDHGFICDVVLARDRRGVERFYALPASGGTPRLDPGLELVAVRHSDLSRSTAERIAERLNAGLRDPELGPDAVPPSEAESD